MARRAIPANLLSPGWPFAALFSLLLAVAAFAQRVSLAPQLHAGQTLVYRVDFSATRSTKSDSPISSPQAAPSTELDISCVLQVEVMEAGPDGFHLKTYVSADSERASSAPSAAQSPDAKKMVEAYVAANGTASHIKGLAELSTAEQFAWQAWLSQFTSSLTYPKPRLHIGQKWELTEPETAPSPIAKLVWNKKYQYVRDEPCDPSTRVASCAVVLVEARLQQRSSASNATPDDFRARHLVTRGTASGSNETILYISRATGLLVRSSEVAQQAMNATVALADGSNQVRYAISAKSRSVIRLQDSGAAQSKGSSVTP